MNYFVHCDYQCPFLAATGAAPMNQQALHGQAMNQVQQQPPMAHMQGPGEIKRLFTFFFQHLNSNPFFSVTKTGNNANNLGTKGHVKRYSNQRQRTGLETQAQSQAQTQQLPMNVVIQQQQPQQPSQQPQNPLQTNSHQTPPQNVVPNVSAPAQFQPNYFPNEYPGR